MSENSGLRDVEILQAIIGSLSNLEPQDRERVLQTAAIFFGISLGKGTPGQTARHGIGLTNSQETLGTPFSDHPDLSSKEFMLQKAPKTDVERVACLAYYLAHYRDTPHFKTLDISKLNTEAAQVKFANASTSVNNAATMGYLVPASRGNKQLSATGEQFVDALPDRDQAKGVLQRVRQRRAKKSRRKKNANQS